MIAINEIYCGDCLQVMQQIDSESVDLTITSPPYDNLRNYKGYDFNFEGIAKELYRFTKKGGIVVWVVGDATIDGSETGTSFRQALYFKDVCGFNLHDTMIYEKNGMAYPEINRYYNIFEYMFVLSKGKPKTVNLLADKKNRWANTLSFGNTSNRQYDGTLKLRGKRLIKEFSIRFNIWRFNTGNAYSASDKLAYKHPAIFPEKLAIDHILSWSNKGDLVLDPMIGSGTTAIACIRTDRNYIGIDISEEYCNIARKRITNELKQLKLDL